MNIENIPTLRVDIEKVGPQGFSAYEIYLQGGGTLSETEWLESLKGETGTTPDVQAGETITLQPEEQAQVTRTGTIESPVFTFAIPQGKEGVQGIQGPEGKQGPEGPQGPEGKQGPQGIQGPEGKQGVQGPEGKAGEDGKSAYQIWLDQGNEGTEQDFLNSLVGPEGAGGISLEEIKTITGELENLSTEDKSNLVNAINEVLSNAGSITELTSNCSLYTRPFGLYINKSTIGTIYVNIESNTTPSGSNTGVAINIDEIVLFTKSGSYRILVAFKSDGIRIYTGNKTYSTTITDTGGQTIKSKKTFSVLPESSVAPTSDTQLVNKKYVDDLLENIGGSGIIELTQNCSLYQAASGVYVNKHTSVIYVAIQNSYVPTGSTTGIAILPGELFLIDVVNITTRILIKFTETGARVYYNNQNSRSPINTSGDQTINGKKTFYTDLPESNVTPTTDNQFTNKKYVDDAIKNSITSALEASY